MGAFFSPSPALPLGLLEKTALRSIWHASDLFAAFLLFPVLGRERKLLAFRGEVRCVALVELGQCQAVAFVLNQGERAALIQALPGVMGELVSLFPALGRAR